ncbi:MAG: NUDIX hydrolase [Marinilabiliales bacterium]|nr:MAG: NUDIX hydrolase [Marinilabiliales bacterium]
MTNSGKYCYDYPRPAVSGDCLIFGFDGEDLNILLIERGKEPYKGRWTFPGGFLDMDETTLQCAERELKEETGIEGGKLEQLGAFSGVDRDPRGRVITIAYYTVVRNPENQPVAGDDAADARWFKVKDIPPLAFDHDLVMRAAITRLQAIIKDSGLLPANEMTFTGTEMEKLKSLILSLSFEPYMPE